MTYINSILETINSTPLLKLNNISKKYQTNNNIFAKLESFNPYGSIKDRIILSMIEDAEKKGLLKPNISTIIESSTGNTGIALASIGRLKGYNVIVILPETASLERKKLVKYFGAELIIAPANLGRLDMMQKAKEIEKNNPNHFWINQYNNQSNPELHYQVTATELWNDLEGNIDILVAGIGTGGTISGIGKYLKEKNPNIKIIGIEPQNKKDHKIEGLQPINNTNDDFIPTTLNTSYIDEIIEVSDKEAIKHTQELIEVEGLPAGISSGANLKVILDIDKRYHDKNIVFINHDDVFRYMSTDLF